MNKVCLMGRLTKDPEYSMTPSETAVSKFSLAVRKDADKADFFDMVAFNGTAEHIRKWFKKGQLCAVTGRLSQNVWEKDGKKYSKIEVIVEEIDFAGSKETEQPSVSDSDGFIPMGDDKLPF